MPAELLASDLFMEIFAHSHSDSQFLRHRPQHWNSIMHPPHCGQTKLMIEEMRLALDSPGKVSIVLMFALPNIGFFQKPRLRFTLQAQCQRETSSKAAFATDCSGTWVACVRTTDKHLASDRASPPWSCVPLVHAR